jgi:hypothetical protein
MPREMAIVIAEWGKEGSGRKSASGCTLLEIRRSKAGGVSGLDFGDGQFWTVGNGQPCPVFGFQRDVAAADHGRLTVVIDVK